MMMIVWFLKIVDFFRNWVSKNVCRVSEMSEFLKLIKIFILKLYTAQL